MEKIPAKFIGKGEWISFVYMLPFMARELKQ